MYTTAGRLKEKTVNIMNTKLRTPAYARKHRQKLGLNSKALLT